MSAIRKPGLEEVSDGGVDWEQRYRQGDTPWEKGTAHPALVEWLKTNSLSGRVLVPGCGSGHDVRALAAAGAEVLGLDLAPAALVAAAGYSLAGRETYAPGNFFSPPDEWTQTFDGIFEHTCFCAIAPARRIAYAAAAAKLLKPGGHFLAIFYLDPGHDGEGPPFGCSTGELEELFSANFELIEEQKNLATYPGREGREILRLLVKR